MKKLLISLLILSMMLTIMPLNAFAESAIRIGDIDSDGNIGSMDYLYLKRAYFSQYNLSSIAVGDIDSDGSISSMDYLYLKRAYFSQYIIVQKNDGFKPYEYDDYKIKKASGNIEIDGVISDGEYATVFEFDANELAWSIDSAETAADYEPKLYISWDENFLYTAVSIATFKPRTYDNTDYMSYRPFIFDRRHVQTAVLLDDPTNPKYYPSNGEAWDWADAYIADYASEWTISAQPDGTKIYADHFGYVTYAADYKTTYECGISLSSDGNTEIYEQAIPWDLLDKGEGYTAMAGNIIGYAFSAACEEVDIFEQWEVENVIYACFGSGIINGKNFSNYVGLTLID